MLTAVPGQQIYRDEDKPLYKTGNKILIAICVYNMALFLGAKLFYLEKNRYVISPIKDTPVMKDPVAEINIGRANESGTRCLIKKNNRILRLHRIEEIKGLLTHPLLDSGAALYSWLMNANLEARFPVCTLTTDSAGPEMCMATQRGKQVSHPIKVL